MPYVQGGKGGDHSISYNKYCIINLDKKMLLHILKVMYRNMQSNKIQSKNALIINIIPLLVHFVVP